MTPLRVHLVHAPDPEPLARLRELIVPQVEITCGPELPAPPAYHVLVTGRPERAQLAASPHLRMLVIPWAGLPVTTRDLLREFPGIAVHNLHHNAAPVAELVLALLLAATKFVLPLDRALRAGDWTPRYQPPRARLLEGGTALILGYGAIGQRVARSCRALGMRVLATRRHPERVPPDCPDAVYGPDALPDLLPRADALIITLPLTDATRGLIGADELARLPEGAVLVNVGRGPIVEEGALYHALRDGALHAAGLDVWYRYPPDEEARAHTWPSEYPFHELDNVVLSPHRGGAVGAQQTAMLRMTALAALFNAVAQGHAAPNRVDVDAGY